MKEQIRKLEEQLRQYQMAYEWGDIPEAELLKATANINAEIETLKTLTDKTA